MYINNFYEKYLNKIYLYNCEKINLKSFNFFTELFKIILDYIMSLIIVIIFSPIIIYSIYRIKKESPDGPILFKQKRIGKNGKIFYCYKFRTMKTNINYFNYYTQDNDPRIFPWGKIMRKYRIDEIPQIINIIKGEMHLIGPRPEWDELAREYEKKIQCYKKRYLIKPGITGWAQVNYKYGENLDDTKEKLSYDLFYIKNWSIILEIKIIFLTVLIILLKKGK